MLIGNKRMKQNHNNLEQNNEKYSTNPLFLYTFSIAVIIVRVYSKLLENKKHYNQ